MGERAQKLENIGFAWTTGHKATVRPPPWQERFEQLVKYKEENGDTLVPRNHILGEWVRSQVSTGVQNLALLILVSADCTEIMHPSLWAKGPRN